MKDLLSKHRAQGQLQLSQATRSTENASVHKLFIRYLQDISQSWSNGSTTVSYTPANAPGPFPTQRPPISQIMVEQTRLQQALAALAPYASTTIELCLDTPASLSSVTLSTGKIASPVTETISGKDYILIGPATKLRLDFFSLQHIVTSAPEHVTHWRLCIDRAAEAVQLIPLPYAVQDTALLWRHELRSHFL